MQIKFYDAKIQDVYLQPGQYSTPLNFSTEQNVLFYDSLFDL